MERMIDIHSHILPGIDDGARDMDEAMEMLAIAYDQGIRIIVATPHYSTYIHEYTVKELMKIVRQINLAAQSLGMDMQIILGNRHLQ